jgi:hypothetical protein
MSNGEAASEDRIDVNRVIQWGASSLSVALGGLGLIMITFVSQTWSSIPKDKHYDAISLLYACGAHFLLSWIFLMSAAVILGRPTRLSIKLSVGFAAFVYMLWSLVTQHRALAALFLAKQWSLPLPFGDFYYDSMSLLIGNETTLYWSPLITSYVAMAIVVICLRPLDSIIQK